MLTPEEKARYARHLIIPEWGLEGQRKLKAAKVLVVGAGGFETPALLYMAGGGVGHIGIVDFDTVEESNLQRQVIYSVEDVGRPKAETARRRLLALNPHLNITIHNTALTRENALSIISRYDVVADGTDNFPTRYLVNDACVLAGKPNVYASVFRFEGQVSVFNYAYPDGSRGPNYRHVFPAPPPRGTVPSCADAGVLGVLPGIIGSIQASEVLKVITGLGEPLAGRLFIFDVAAFRTRILNIGTGHQVDIEELVDYNAFCGTPGKVSVKSISAEAFLEMRAARADYLLVDVREAEEYEAGGLGGLPLPLSRFDPHTAPIPKDRKVVVYCRSGMRSAEAIRRLQETYPYDNLYSLAGGMLAVMDSTQ